MVRISIRTAKPQQKPRNPMVPCCGFGQNKV